MTLIQRIPLFLIVFIVFNVVMVVAPDMLTSVPSQVPAASTPAASPAAASTPAASPAAASAPADSPAATATPEASTPEASPETTSTPEASTPAASPAAPATDPTNPTALAPNPGTTKRTVATVADTTNPDISGRVNLSIIPLFQARLPSGVLWYPTMNDLLLLFAVIILFIELIKSARAPAGTIVEPILSMFVFCAFLVEFLVHKAAGTSTFLVVTALVLIDVIAGFTLAARSIGKGKAI